MAVIEYAVANGVAHLELNRPDAANAFNLDMAHEFGRAVADAAAASDVRALFISGAGPRFCAGGDVSSFTSAEDSSHYLHELATDLDKAVRALAATEKLVVVAVHGAVAGAGLALMLSCDLVVAAPDTRFTFAYPGIGLTPDCGVSYLLPRAIGQQRALTFALTGITLLAHQALAWGLVSEVSDDAQRRAQSLATDLAEGPHQALGQTRRLLRQGWDRSREEVGAEEALTISRMVQGDEAETLIAAWSRRSSRRS